MEQSVKLLAKPVRGPEFIPRAHKKVSGVVASSCKPHAQKTGKGGSQGLSGSHHSLTDKILPQKSGSTVPKDNI